MMWITEHLHYIDSFKTSKQNSLNYTVHDFNRLLFLKKPRKLVTAIINDFRYKYTYDLSIIED